MGQRAVRLDQLDYVITFGKVYDRAGATWFVLRRKDIPPDDLVYDWIAKMVGVVVCTEDGSVSTVYHREDPSHHVRQKVKYDRRRSRHDEPDAA